MKNNKGVTLVELLVVIVVMGIIAGFAIPAVGGIIDNANRDGVLNDATLVENAARLHCSTTVCEDLIIGAGEYYELTWDDLAGYVDGIDTGKYTEANTGVVIAIGDGDNWAVSLTGNSQGDYNFPPEPEATNPAPANTITVDTSNGTLATADHWYVPSDSTRDQVE